ncbi:MAG: homocysteine S-methyltransferase [Actinomycetota bacterium]
MSDRPSRRIVLIDGGLSTALEDLGVDTDGPLWTARALVDRLDDLESAHTAFITAGAQIITTASYQCPATDEKMLRASTSIARRAVAGTSTRVAASVGPYGAILADGSEYHGRYPVSFDVVSDHHRRKLSVLVDSGPDLLAVETQPRADEARIIADLLCDLGAPPAWFSFCFGDESTTCGGDSIPDVLAAVADYPDLVAVGVNCTSPSLVAPILRRMRAVSSDLPLVVYPNHGGHWRAEDRTWIAPESPVNQGRWLEECLDIGVDYLGGCCGVGPADLARLVEEVRTRP